MADPAHLPGLLVLVVGPSGAGKDTLIDGARRRLAGDPGIVFAQRDITRRAEAGGEAHAEVSLDVFAARLRAGGYLLAWEAHGLRYGVPATLANDLAAGRTVVVNVSRTVLAEARARFPRIRVLNVTAAAAVLAARLATRGRESAEAIQKRLDRAVEHEVAGPDVVEIQNDQDLETGVSRFIAGLVAA